MIPDYDTIPIDVLPYLLPTETQVIIVRRHLSVLAPALGLLIAIVTTFGLSAADVITAGTPALVTLGILIAPSGYLFYRSLLTWSRAFFIITSIRIVLINWRRRHGLAIVPISEASDVTFIRTLPGRLLGYGSLLFELPNTPRRARKFSRLPYPEQLYLEVAGLCYRDA